MLDSMFLLYIQLCQISHGYMYRSIQLLWQCFWLLLCQYSSLASISPLPSSLDLRKCYSINWILSKKIIQKDDLSLSFSGLFLFLYTSTPLGSRKNEFRDWRECIYNILQRAK